MKRNENLVPLSREHHFGLLCMWKIRQGVTKGIAYKRILNYVNYFWKESLSRHFETEDRVLPEMENAILQNQMEQEHSQIRKLISHINASDDKQLLLDFANALQNHIRFEERVVFPEYEQNLSDEQMKEIGKLLSDSDHKGIDDYPDEFWK